MEISGGSFRMKRSRNGESESKSNMALYQQYESLQEQWVALKNSRSHRRHSLSVTLSNQTVLDSARCLLSNSPRGLMSSLQYEDHANVEGCVVKDKLGRKLSFEGAGIVINESSKQEEVYHSEVTSVTSFGSNVVTRRANRLPLGDNVMGGWKVTMVWFSVLIMLFIFAIIVLNENQEEIMLVPT